MWRLIVQNEEGRKAEIPLEAGEITIGRGDQNTVQLDDRNVSRQHARIRQLDNSYVLEDLGSSNGIWVNGRRLTGNSLVKPGDSFRLGDYEFWVEDDSMGVSVELSNVGFEPSPRWVDLETSKARLVLNNAISPGREFPLIGSTLRLGRAPGNDIRIEDPTVLAHHARLERLDAGEWQVQALDGAPLSVNGQRQTLAKLAAGDDLSVGNVSLKYVRPDRPGPLSESGEAMSGPAQRLKAMLFLALVAGLAGIAGAAMVLFWLKDQPQREAPPPALARTSPEPPRAKTPAVAPPEKVPSPAAQEISSPAKHPGESVDSAPADRSPARRYEPKIYAAKAAIARKDFRRAVDLLAPLRAPDGSRPADADALMREANTELEAKKNLSLAQKNLVSGRLDEATRLLDRASDTKAYAREYRQLKARTEKLAALRQVKRPRGKEGDDGRPPSPARVAVAVPKDPPIEQDIRVSPPEPKTAELKPVDFAPVPAPVPPPAPAPSSASGELPAIAAMEAKAPGQQTPADPGAWVVIAHPSMRSALSRGELRRIFSGDSVPTDGNRIIQVVMGPVGSASRRNFISQELGRTEAQFRAAWTRLSFRGGGVKSPLEMNDDASVVATVASRPGTIGVVREGTDLAGVLQVDVR